MKFILIIFSAVMVFVLTSCKNNPSQAQEEANTGNAELKVKSTDDRLLIGACYYPWYRKNSHWSGDNLRQNLVPAQLPVMGKYDCIDQALISQHVQWSVRAGIDFWISSWWGPGSAEDDVILQGHLKNQDFLKNMGYCILLEPWTGLPIEVNGNYINRFLTNLDYLAKNHFNNPNYLKIDNKPVLYIYLTREMTGDYKTLFESADSLLRNKGYDGLYVVGDEIYWRQFSESHLTYMEAVTAYNPHVSESWVSDPVKFVTRTKSEMYDPWMTIVNNRSKSFWVDVLPGFNDLGVRPAQQHPVIPRDSVTTFNNFLNSAKLVLKAQTLKLKVLVITSWNEWHEDTQIEPVNASLQATQKPFNLTNGFWYHGYGYSYLDILGNFKRDFNK